jgi:DNA-binding CsgD family transcriptional regulator
MNDRRPRERQRPGGIAIAPAATAGTVCPTNPNGLTGTTPWTPSPATPAAGPDWADCNLRYATLADALRRRSPALAIVFLTHVPSVRFLSRNRVPIPEGAAYLRKDQLSDKDILLDALEAALLGEVTAEHRHDTLLGRTNPALSRTQAAVMDLVAQGRTTKEIARIRGTSPRTVRDVVKRSRARLGAEDCEPSTDTADLPPGETVSPDVP